MLPIDLNDMTSVSQSVARYSESALLQLHWINTVSYSSDPIGTLSPRIRGCLHRIIASAGIVLEYNLNVEMEKQM